MRYLIVFLLVMLPITSFAEEVEIYGAEQINLSHENPFNRLNREIEIRYIIRNNSEKTLELLSVLLIWRDISGVIIQRQPRRPITSRLSGLPPGQALREAEIIADATLQLREASTFSVVITEVRFSD